MTIVKTDACIVHQDGTTTETTVGWIPPSFQVEPIAEAFAEIMRQWLTRDEFAEMKRRNETDSAYAGAACASHDFCDANMAMDAAFRQVMDRAPDVVGEGLAVEMDCALWNDAWELARKLYLGHQGG